MGRVYFRFLSVLFLASLLFTVLHPPRSDFGSFNRRSWGLVFSFVPRLKNVAFVHLNRYAGSSRRRHARCFRVPVSIVVPVATVSVRQFLSCENTPRLHPDPKVPNTYTSCSAQRLDRGCWVLLHSSNSYTKGSSAVSFTETETPSSRCCVSIHYKLIGVSLRLRTLLAHPDWWLR